MHSSENKYKTSMVETSLPCFEEYYDVSVP